jgi:predicted 3-demethylubiquinone-9 3-methyltransferase (glyoxalase superfamily)
LWFDHQAEQAMQHYLSFFKNGRAAHVSRNDGQVVSVTFELEGQRFIGLNASPHHQFNEAISFFVSCETQDDIDCYGKS